MHVVDGIRRVHSDPVTPPVATRRRRPRFIGWLATLLVVVGLTWLVQPVLAALPLTSWSDRAAAVALLKPGRYLVLFQNSRELRPTGGFLGSFAEIELGWGLSIRSVSVETNIYARDAEYGPVLNVEAPEPLRAFLGEAPWTLRDSNWDLDFPTAAQTIAWFYEHEGGQPVDGVIALDARVLERIVRLTGPIDLPEFDLYLTAETVIDTLQEEIEKNYWYRTSNITENQPKKVLGALLPIVLERLAALDLSSLSALAVDALDAKEVQLSVTDSALADVFARAQWDGHLRTDETDDFLIANEANLTPVNGLARVLGSKNSHEIDRATRLTRSSTGLRRLETTRTHRGAMVWPGGPNTSYLRFVVPAGSQLTRAERNGRDITAEVRQSNEHGAVVFGLTSTVNPGETEEIVVDYALSTQGQPSFLFGRQAGVPVQDFELWDGQELRFRGSLDKDLILAPRD